MKFLPLDEKTEPGETGFDGDHDILQRARTGKSLSNLSNEVEDPLVIAPDGKCS